MNIQRKQEEHKKDWSKVKVEWREPKVADAVRAEKVCSSKQGSKAYEIALLSQICTFDGQSLAYEELMEAPDFFLSSLYAGIHTEVSSHWVELLLSSLDKDGSAIQS